jgi:hypothetical protein
MRKLTFLLFIQIITLSARSQNTTCKSLHTGTFKVYTKASGTTLIKRSSKIQIEKNDDLGIEMIFSVRWVNSCTYELRPLKIISGNPNLLGNGKRVLTTKIKDITNSSYVAETSANFIPDVIELKVEILE